MERPLQQMIFQPLQMMTSLPKKKGSIDGGGGTSSATYFLGMEVGNEES